MKFKSMILIILSILLVFCSALPVLAEEIGPSTPGYTDGHKLGQEDKKGGLPKRSEEQLNTYIKNLYPDFLKDQKWVAAFKAGYAAGYGKEEKPGEEDKVKVWDSGGKELGTLFGKIAAIEDYMAGRRMDWQRAMPSERSLYHDFQLDRIGSLESLAFIKAFYEGFKNAYEEAYAQAMADNNNLGVKTGAEYGEEAGKLMGEMKGRSDFHNGKPSDHRAYALTDSEILEHFQLKNGQDFERAFLATFRDAYQKAYEAAYQAELMGDAKMKFENGFENGQQAGGNLALRNATADVFKKIPYDPNRAKPSREEIFSEYNLALHNPVYADEFIAGFLAAYTKVYNDTYKSMTADTASAKTTSEVVPLAGLTLSSGDQRMAVEIPGGVYYDETMLSIDVLPSGYIKNFGYIEASKPYRISVLNPNGNVDDTTKLRIAFEYHGKPRKSFGESSDGFPGNTSNAGIYKLEGSRWMYLDSKVINGMITTEVNPQTITETGTVFAVIVDRSYAYLHDVRGHWAKDEINAMIRRGVISGYPDKTYRPDAPITRAEFLTLLSRHYGWQMTGFEFPMRQFTDAPTFGFFAPYIQFGSSRGYIVGYPDGQFKPNRSISYREINWIMQRVTGNLNFNWQDYARLMVNKKSVRSKSLTNLDQPITRAEFAFLMYTMDTWKY